MSVNGFVNFKAVDENGNSPADRELDELELEAEQKAEKFSVAKFKRINPIPGRIGFLLRNLHKDVGTRNEMVMSFIDLVDEVNKRKFVRTLRQWWEVLDDYSKRRVDIFDLFCEKYDINRARLWAVIQEGMFVSNDALTKTALDGFKPKFIALMQKMVMNTKNSADRKVMAEALGLIGGEVPQVVNEINNNSQTLIVNNNDSPIPSFADSIRRSDKNVRTSIKSVAPKELTEGEQNYITVDGYIVAEEEKETVNKVSFEDIEKQLLEVGKE